MAQNFISCVRRIAHPKPSFASCRLVSTSILLPENEPPTDLSDPVVKARLKECLDKVRSKVEEIPIVIGGQKFHTDNVKYQISPSEKNLKIAKYSFADKTLIEKAIENAIISREKWEKTPFDQRSPIFLRAADLLATKYRYEALAACMLGQGKTAIQADIDIVAESIDFMKFNVAYAKDIYDGPPLHQPSFTINRVIYRGLEGFVAAISPFNFAAIGCNLATAPALVGNVVLHKPSDLAMLSNWLIYKVLMESGLPDGVIQFVPADGPTFGEVITSSPFLAGINFTGSVGTFKSIWKMVAKNMDNYRTFPRLVGECGGKNYHFVHESADAESVVNGTIRSAFEYSGQKCSACSRLYVPDTLWPEIKEQLRTSLRQVKTGPVDDASSFLSAVIDEKSFAKIKSYIEHAKNSPDMEIIYGGKCDDSVGYFVEPTLIETKNPKAKLMEEEIFGPVVTAYVYPANQYLEHLKLADQTSAYGLTGSIFARDRSAIIAASDVLRQSAGNFYINDKSTGSVVGQQPFGGARLSGTNDKAGMGAYLLKWISPQSVKETLVPLEEWKYPVMK